MAVHKPKQKIFVDGPQQLTSGSDTWQNNASSVLRILSEGSFKQYEYLSALVIIFHVKKH